MKVFLKHVYRIFVLWVVLGMCYAQLELWWRGFTYIEMCAVGGLAGLCIGFLNQSRGFCKLKIWQQSVIGTAVTLVIEYISGYILNIRLGLHIWDYSGLPMNLNGQISFPYAILWFFLMPIAIYVDDWMRYKLFNEKKPRGNVFYNYWLLIDGK